MDGAGAARHDGGQYTFNPRGDSECVFGDVDGLFINDARLGGFTVSVLVSNVFARSVTVMLPWMLLEHAG